MIFLSPKNCIKWTSGLSSFPLNFPAYFKAFSAALKKLRSNLAPSCAKMFNQIVANPKKQTPGPVCSFRIEPHKATFKLLIAVQGDSSCSFLSLIFKECTGYRPPLKIVKSQSNGSSIESNINNFILVT
jgi:hypothetical protein